MAQQQIWNDAPNAYIEPFKDVISHINVKGESVRVTITGLMKKNKLEVRLDNGAYKWVLLQALVR